MSDLIIEYTDFSSDIEMPPRYKVESITVKAAGSGGLALVCGYNGSGNPQVSLTDLIDGEVVSLSSVKTILAAGTSVAKLRVALSRTR